ncbi:MAG: fibronectin type III domain-containing protein [Acidobacteriota bacterium]|nr:fibronectin type III domain-containing protein [Acidobacteriota bacterium]MDQ7087024.1 fibronectin type III domain-containing protein [Acidobacteriota bacterium]
MKIVGGMALILAVLALAGGGVRAGELVLAWGEPTDDLTAGFEVEVLDEDGRMVQVLDVGLATRAVITGLADGRRYGFRLRPYDSFGNAAARAGRTLVSYPAPRIDGVEGDVRPGRESLVSISGANFDDGAWVLSRREGLTVVQTTVIRHDLAVIAVLAEDAAGVSPADLLVVNPVPKAPAYAAAHPAVLDLDGSGGLDERDLALLEQLFGVERGDPVYRTSWDPTGDGVIDGEDAAWLREALSRRARRARRAP